MPLKIQTVKNRDNSIKNHLTYNKEKEEKEKSFHCVWDIEMKLEQRASGYRIVARMNYLRAYMRSLGNLLNISEGRSFAFRSFSVSRPCNYQEMFVKEISLTIL